VNVLRSCEAFLVKRSSKLFQKALEKKFGKFLFTFRDWKLLIELFSLLTKAGGKKGEKRKKK
jgi:hypothetical protein